MGAREDLLQTAHALFVSKGYANTSVGELARRSGLTTGAVYHHFEHKLGLYRAVIEQIVDDVAGIAAEKMAAVDDPWDKLRAGMNAVLDACLTPPVRHAYTEAATVLGLEQWRLLEASRTDHLLAGTMAALAASGELSGHDPRFLAPILKGAIVEGAMAIVTADDEVAARARVGESLEALLSGIRRRG